MARITPSWPQPSHPHLLEVIDPPGAFASFTRSLVSMAAGSVLARIDMPPLTFANKAYSTVQVSRTQHIELNCDFLFTNHSCEPSVEFHVQRVGEAVAIEVRVAARRAADGSIMGLKEGDELTFFYPSTEWEMAQPFACNCGTRTCRKWIAGAKTMGIGKFSGLFLNDHIKDLVYEQEKGFAKRSGINGVIEARNPSIGFVDQVNEVGARHEVSARALAGEMGGDTTL